MTSFRRVRRFIGKRATQVLYSDVHEKVFFKKKTANHYKAVSIKHKGQ